MNDMMRNREDLRLERYKQQLAIPAERYRLTLWTGIGPSVIMVAALLLLFAYILPAARGSWNEELTINGTAETLMLAAPSEIECDKHKKDRELSWKGVTFAQSYVIYHQGPYAKDYYEVGEVDSHKTTYSVRPSYFRHRWFVTSSVSSWESDPSESISVYCRQDTHFPGPKKPEAENHHSQRTVEITWEATSGAILYGVVRAGEADRQPRGGR